ncbi:hypothetical protein AK812_SmicGene41648 [Symbiodinium microadriaticum]|uniref:Uncharacterized protein n=2 Tax=Symbiodinium TaxID=2949 RepID=A0A1Q9C5K3_SYMMI|nr:hypothetical protein AK812_SmicGene41648 [Symbiodinium microadriaticum]
MRLAWFIQNAIGGLRPIQGAAARVVPKSGSGLGLQRRDLLALLEGKAPVLVLPGAISDEVCREASDWLLQQSAAAERSGGSSARRFAEWRLGRDPDAPASDYSKLGYTKTDVLIQEGFRMKASTPAPNSYLQRAEETTKSLISAFPPGQFPLDVIREELNSLPAVSCRLERCPSTARKFLPCVVRRMVVDAEKAMCTWTVSDLEVLFRSTCAMYLRVPEESSGGELLLHAVQKNAFQRFLNAHFFETIDMQNFYPDQKFYTQEMLGRIEPIVYRPRVGDVVFIVLGQDRFDGTDRVTFRIKHSLVIPALACNLRCDPGRTRSPKKLTTSCSTGSLAEIGKSNKTKATLGEELLKRWLRGIASQLAYLFPVRENTKGSYSLMCWRDTTDDIRVLRRQFSEILDRGSLLTWLPNILYRIQLIHMQFETSSLHRDSAGCRSKPLFRSQATRQQKAVSILSMQFDSLPFRGTLSWDVLRSLPVSTHYEMTLKLVGTAVSSLPR